MASGLQLVGDWSKAKAILSGIEERFKAAGRRAMLQEANMFRAEMVKGLREGALGGQAFAALAPSTLAVRRGSGFKGSKPGIERGDMRNAITVKVRDGGDAVFVGILRRAKGRDGQPLVNVAEIFENGKGPIAVPITTKSSRYYHMMARKGGLDLPRRTGAKVAVVIIKIPARPFMRPVFEKFGKPEDVRARFYARMAEIFASAAIS